MFASVDADWVAGKAMPVPDADVAPSRANVVPFPTARDWVKVIAFPAVPDTAEDRMTLLGGY